MRGRFDRAQEVGFDSDDCERREDEAGRIAAVGVPYELPGEQGAGALAGGDVLREAVRHVVKTIHVPEGFIEVFAGNAKSGACGAHEVCQLRLLERDRDSGLPNGCNGLPGIVNDRDAERRNGFGDVCEIAGRRRQLA